ncbi:hypothetical protein [Nocardia sp. NPDC020380]|uniref:hypothetical protein n=1 Tax=Nocardia sp. NPDC020380 TaxID=3364309 RepID=UPI0037B54894
MRNTPAITDITGYLRVHGWVDSGRWRTATIWTRQDFDVLVPPSTSVADAGIRLRELVRCVADAEQRSPDAVWRDMSAPTADTVSYRAVRDGDPITVALGAHTVLAVRDLVVACAHEVLGEPAPARRSPMPGPVHALLEQSLLALSNELALEVSVPMTDGDPDSLGRRTTLRMQHIAAALRRIADSAESSAIEDIARQGVSDAECAALAELAGPEYDLPFELGFHWSWRAPREDTTVRYPAGAGRRIARASGSRAQRSRDGGPGAVQGDVIALSDDPGGARWRIKVRGNLELNGTAVDGIRTVAVALGDEQNYALALAAHRDGQTVRAEGTAAPHRRGTEITVTAGGFTTGRQTQP